VQPASPEARRLAQRLKQLREQQWPDVTLTQADLAKAFSTDKALAPATVSSWESLTSPKPPPRPRLLTYARFFATPRSVEEKLPKLLPLAALTPDELATYTRLETELLKLRSLATEDSGEEEIASGRSWHFSDSGPAIFVCAELPDSQTGPLASPSDPNYTELQAYADIDALMELWGHVRAENPRLDVNFRIPAEVRHNDLTGHIILIGGVVWNEITDRLSEMANLPVKQFEHPDLDTGEIFSAVVDRKEKEFWPKWKDKDRKVLAEDVGLLARVPNPLNSSRTLTICNGIHSRGVYGAVRSLTDTRLRDANERYISANFGNSPSFAILMSVQVIKNKAMTPDFTGNGVVLYQWPQESV
jgi:hypothetical protein